MLCVILILSMGKRARGERLRMCRGTTDRNTELRQGGAPFSRGAKRRGDPVAPPPTTGEFLRAMSRSLAQRPLDRFAHARDDDRGSLSLARNSQAPHRRPRASRSGAAGDASRRTFFTDTNVLRDACFAGSSGRGRCGAASLAVTLARKIFRKLLKRWNPRPTFIPAKARGGLLRRALRGRAAGRSRSSGRSRSRPCCG